MTTTTISKFIIAITITASILTIAGLIAQAQTAPTKSTNSIREVATEVTEHSVELTAPIAPIFGSVEVPKLMTQSAPTITPVLVEQVSEVTTPTAEVVKAVTTTVTPETTAEAPESDAIGHGGGYAPEVECNNPFCGRGVSDEFYNTRNEFQRGTDEGQNNI